MILNLVYFVVGVLQECIWVTAVSLMRTTFYYIMYASHDSIIDLACLWLEDVNQFYIAADQVDVLLLQPGGLGLQDGLTAVTCQRLVLLQRLCESTEILYS